MYGKASESCCESESRSVVSTSLRPRGLYSPWNSPGQDTGAGSLSLLQRDLPSPGINPSSPPLWADSLPAEPPGKHGKAKGQETLEELSRGGITLPDQLWYTLKRNMIQL